MMPFGLCNVPGCFSVLCLCLEHSIARLLYLDDIIVFSSSVEEHLGQKDVAMNRLGQEGLMVKLEKCCCFFPRRRGSTWAT